MYKALRSVLRVDVINTNIVHIITSGVLYVYAWDLCKSHTLLAKGFINTKRSKKIKQNYEKKSKKIINEHYSR